MTAQLPTHYFQRTFSSAHRITHWPIHFAIIIAPTQSTSPTRDLDKVYTEDLHTYLKENFSWFRFMAVTDPDNQASTPCWAVNSEWQQACEIGLSYGLEAIYFVSDNTLSVSYCDERRKPIFVDAFLNRYTVSETD
jgi:hypothetical protein